MNKLKINLGDIGFSLGIVSIFMVMVPFFRIGHFLSIIKNAIFALLMGIVGLILVSIQSKKHADEMVKFGFLANFIAIVLAVTSLIFFGLVKI